jgi:hypothetical protein
MFYFLTDDFALRRRSLSNLKIDTQFSMACSKRCAEWFSSTIFFASLRPWKAWSRVLHKGWPESDVLERFYQLLAGFGGQVGDGFELALHRVQLLGFALRLQLRPSFLRGPRGAFGLGAELSPGCRSGFLALALQVGFFFSGLSSWRWWFR